ncbi:MAG: hypothetical protein J6I98_05245, partial [Clostridia bacterium]|nr:hypothetical protein [Clostridia bacterium]
PITYKPFCIYYGFKAFGELYMLGNQAECTVEEENLYAVAAANGDERAVLIANTGAETVLHTGLDGFDVYLVDETHALEKAELDSAALAIGENQVVLLKKAIV